VLVVGLLVIGVRALLQEGERYAGTNSVPANQVAVELEGGRQLCQKGELVPAETAAVEFAQATSDERAPGLEVELRDGDGRVLARGEKPGGYGPTVVAVEIPVQREERAGVDVCVRVADGGKLALYGLAAPTGRLTLAGKDRAGVLRIGYKRPGSETWLALLPTIAERFAVAKTRLAGPWTFWFVWALLLIAAGIGIRTVLR
jgi:hypothetical protein